MALKLVEFLREAATRLDAVQQAAESGEMDPIRLADAFTGGNYSEAADDAARDGRWWELFGLDAHPTTPRELDRAWRKWAVKNHPDQGHPEPTFRFMRTLYEKQKVRLAT